MLDVALHTAASVLYSAWHLTAWDGPFSSAIEGKLWKVSTIGVASSLILEGILLFVVFLPSVFRRLVDPVDSDYQEKRSAPKGPYLLLESPGYGVLVFIYILGGLICCFLIFSRVYLLVESFISLAFAPDEVFAMVAWSVYIPHIG